MKKRFFVALLALMMLAPGTAFADGRYETVSTGENIIGDANLSVFATTGALEDGATVELTARNGIAFAQGTGYREYTAQGNSDWVFKGFDYSQVYKGEELGNRKGTYTPHIKPTGYSFTQSGTWETPYVAGSSTIRVNRLYTIGETAWRPINYSVYANFNPVVTTVAGEHGYVDTPVLEVEYGSDAAITATADAGYKIASVTVDGVEQAVEENATVYVQNLTGVVEPHKIEVSFAPLPTYTVTYTDGVDGVELFADQVYTDLVVGSSTPAFEGTPVREGYKFAGWSPEVDDAVTGDVTYVAMWDMALVPLVPATPIDPQDDEKPSEDVKPSEDKKDDKDSKKKDNELPETFDAAIVIPGMVAMGAACVAGAKARKNN